MTMREPNTSYRELAWSALGWKWFLVLAAMNLGGVAVGLSLPNATTPIVARWFDLAMMTGGGVVSLVFANRHRRREIDG